MDVQVRHTPSFAVVRCTMTGGEPSAQNQAR